MTVLLVGALTALCDQVTKRVVCDVIPLEEKIPIVPNFFDLTHIRNTGAAWGLLAGLNEWLALTAIVALILLVVFRRSFMCDRVASPIAMGLMTGGILGNLMDRLRLACVVDFLDFHWNYHHFPSFNVADSAICIGVALYLFSALTHRTEGVPAMLRAAANEKRGADNNEDIQQ